MRELWAIYNADGEVEPMTLRYTAHDAWRAFLTTVVGTNKEPGEQVLWRRHGYLAASTQVERCGMVDETRWDRLRKIFA